MPALVLAAACDAAGPLHSEGSRLEELGAFDLASRADGTFSEEPLFAGVERPDDLLSITLVATSAGLGRLGLGVSGDRTLLVDARQPEFSPNRALSGRGLVVVQLPSASATLPLATNILVTARWLSDPGAERAIALRVFGKRPAAGASAAPMVQELPLAIVFVGDGPADDDNLRRALAEARALWRLAGIELGEPSRTRLPADLVADVERLEIDRTLGSDSPALGRLLAHSASVPEANALPIFVVQSIVSGPGLDLWALSGGVPVPPLHGTRRSGIVLSGLVLTQDPRRAGQILAHELGHAMGLYHTTEGQILGGSSAGGSSTGAREAIHDQIDDTPACPLQADQVPSDGQLAPDECRNHDANNLMFWAPTRRATVLTAGQGDIARRSAITR